VNPAAERVLDRARLKGAEEAEVYLSQGTEFTVKVYQHEIESLVSAESRGIGLRTLREHRLTEGVRAAGDFVVYDQLPASSA